MKWKSHPHVPLCCKSICAVCTCLKPGVLNSLEAWEQYQHEGTIFIVARRKPEFFTKFRDASPLTYMEECKAWRRASTIRWLRHPSLTTCDNRSRETVHPWEGRMEAVQNGGSDLKWPLSSEVGRTECSFMEGDWFIPDLSVMGVRNGAWNNLRSKYEQRSKVWNSCNKMVILLGHINTQA